MLYIISLLSLLGCVRFYSIYRHNIEPKISEEERKIQFMRDVERYERRVETCREMGLENEAQKWEETAKLLREYLIETKPWRLD